MRYNVGDIESTAKGTGARANLGKVDFTFVPLHLLAGTARVLMKGSQKYAPWNWAKGMQWSICAGCLMRHFFKWWFCGDEYDKETGEHHLSHVIANALFLLHYSHTYQEGDDRPPVFADFESELPELEKLL